MPTQIKSQPLRVAGNWFSSSGMDQYVTDQFKNLDGATGRFNAGELVCLNGSSPATLIRGDANIVGAAGTNDKLNISKLTVLNDTQPERKLFGIAMRDAPATGQAICPVAILFPGTIVEGNLVDGQVATEAGLAGAGLLTSSIDHLAKTVGIMCDPTNKRWYFTVQAAERCATVIRMGFGVSGDRFGAIGDANIRVMAVIYPEILWLNKVTGATPD